MGIAAGTLKHSNDMYKSMAPLLNTIDSSYRGNYEKKKEQSEKMYLQAEEKAKSVFFEKIEDFKKIDMPDRKNFVKFDDSSKGDLEKTPILNETLRHVIPPEVRNMQAELKKVIQEGIIDKLGKQIEEEAKAQTTFFNGYSLPQSYYELTSGEEIPPSYQEKINEFQKKGAMTNFTNIMQGIAGLRDNCKLMLQECEKDVKAEEDQDSFLRSTNGPKWTALPSNGMNQAFKQNIGMYRMKIQQAEVQDDQAMSQMNNAKQELDILTKSPQELMAMMPETDSYKDVAAKPVSLAIKSALENTEKCQREKSRIHKEAQETLDSLNCIEELMLVHGGQKDKAETFAAQKAPFEELAKQAQQQE